MILTSFCFVVVNFITLALAQEPTILLPQGEIRGIKKATNQRGTVVAFLGIPYALPPVGELRFKLPQAVPASNRTTLADRFRPACPQPDMDRLSASEDCLYLNVWIPEMPVDVKTYPVLVFLEGEMFTHGNPAKYPAEDLAAEGLVVVSIHYRLNIFGFLSLETSEAPGNLGLWDQNMALRWVQNNIGKFGGDPKQVTLMGHGAGGASVTMHMTAAASKGLFERAIVMSGSLFGPWAISRHPRAAAVSVSLLLGCRPHMSDTELLDCLRTYDIRDILQAFAKHQKDLNTTEIFAPVIDTFLSDEEAFLGRDPIVAFWKGDFHRMRVITGVAESEGAAMFSVMKNLAKRSYDELTHIFLTASVPRILDDYGFVGQVWHPVYWTIRYHYFDMVTKGDKAAMLQQMLQLYGDAYYKAPHDRFVNALVRFNVPTYIYRYAYSDPLSNGTGAPHGSELLYLFGPTVYRQEIGVGFSRQDENVADLLKRLWLEFARGGDPTPSQFGPKWELSTRDGLKNFEIAGEQVTRIAYPKHKVAFWNEYLQTLARAAVGEIDPFNTTIKPFDPKYRTDPTQPYQSIMWVLIAAISVILVAFILSMASMRSKRQLV